jgi:ferrochelatase
MNTAVMICNMGGPDSLEAVESYLFNIFNDPDIIDLPFPKFLRSRFAGWLAKKRFPESRSIYSKIGGRTPLTTITQTQADLLEKVLNSGNRSVYKVFPAMRYWHPFIEDIWEKIISEDYEKVIIISLYPFYSTTTTGSLEKIMRKLLLSSRIPKENISFIPRFGNHPLFVEAMVKRIKMEFMAEGGDQFKDVLLSPHSIPLKRIRQGDPYQEEIEKSFQQISKQLPDTRIHLSYQSKIGPVKWLAPSTPDKIMELAGKGVRNLLVYPLGFVADNSETVYEIGMLYKELAMKKGIGNYKRIESLNTNPDFIRVLKEIIFDQEYHQKIS